MSREMKAPTILRPIRGFFCIRTWLVAWVVFFFPVGHALAKGAGPVAGNERALLMAAIRQVDRIKIESLEPYWVDGGEMTWPSFTLEGREAVQKVLDGLEFELLDRSDLWPCLCLGTHRIEFFSGDHYRFGLTYHHWNRLRGGLGAPWWHDAVLTKEGEEALIEALRLHGFPSPHEQREQQRAWVAKNEAAYTSVLEAFPEEARQWIPKLAPGSPFGDDEIRNPSGLIDHFEDKKLLAVTIWRCFGRLVASSNRPLPVERGEPGHFLSEALSRISDSDFDAALDGLREADAEVRQGVISGWTSSHGERQRRYERSIVFAAILDRHIADSAADELVNIASAFEWSALPHVEMRMGRLAERLAAELPLGSAHYVPPHIKLLLMLAERQSEFGRQLSRERLSKAEQSNELLALEVIHAAYAGSGSLGERHLMFPSMWNRCSELAWKLILERDQETPEVYVLAAAARSPSFNVSRDAEDRLAKIGLQALVAEPTRPESDRKIAEGHRAFARGDYESARILLQSVRDQTVQSEYEYALSAFAVGRYDEIRDWMSGRHRSILEKGRAMMLRGCHAFLKGDYHRALRDLAVANELLDGPSGEPGLNVLLHLVCVALGRPEDSPAAGWEFFRYFEEQEMSWDEGLMALAAGRLSDDELIELVGAEPERERPAATCAAHWFLAELARARGDSNGEAAHRERALGAGAYSSIFHILSLRRKIESAWE